MNNRQQTPPPGGMVLGDIYYVLFRHKWKIILLSLAGILTATYLYIFKPPPYQSQAELLIQYVPEAQSLTLLGSDQKVIVPDSRGEDIINSEIQILTSLDVAGEAATNMGAANILAGVGGGGNDPLNAAAFIRSHLQAEPVGQGLSVIVVTFKHPNPQVVQPILQEVINDYFHKHYEIHSAVGQYDDLLTHESANLQVQLSATEQQLADLKNKANIISLDDSRRELANQIAQIQASILDAQADLAGHNAAINQLDNNSTAKTVITNAQPVVPSDQLDAYRNISAQLDLFEKKRQDYLVQGFTTSNTLVQAVDSQIADAQNEKKTLEEKYPQLPDLDVTSETPNNATPASGVDVRTQMAMVAGLQAKIQAWNSQLDQLWTQATNLNALAPQITQLEQTKGIEETNYQNISTSLEQARINEALATDKAPNIKWVQAPSPPFRDWSKTYKKLAMVALSGLGIGLAWAFFIEMFLDRSVKRPAEIEAKLKLSLFLSIPDVNKNGHAHLPQILQRRQLLLNNAKETKTPASNGDSSHGGNGALQVVSLERNRPLQPFYEALRDRLIVYFEVKNLTHKPKLVAVTSAGHGAGVSTIAAGLAASLSETGDGNVLLVDMNLEHGAAQQFYKGKASCGLDAALKSETRENALVQENLYVVTANANNDELPRILPKRFSALVPELKASDYDYIIFDLPPVSQTSLTSRLVRFMDMTLLVVESEKTNRDILSHANTWLVEAGATVGVVLNKTRRYIPGRLHQELPGDK